MQSNGPLNFLWISIEDISPRLGCYGDALARTPSIDRLAASGCRFTRAFSTAGVCAPSRSAIITGMYQTSIGTHHMRTTHQNQYTPEMPTPYSAVIPHYVKPFTQYLRAAGYYCTNNEKTDYQFTPPITAWDENGPQAHWRNRAADQPFFAVFNPTVTHESRMWPDERHPLKTDPNEVELPPYLPDTPKTRSALARHYDNLMLADTRVGELLGQLEADGLAGNTVVILWSDHGEGLPRAKRWLYDAGIRIPLIVRWPGQLEPGSVNEQLVSLVDLGPTLLSLAGLQSPRHMQGQPFLGSQAQPREYIFAARDRHDEAYDMVRAVRDRRYKYIRHYHPELPYLLWIPYRNTHPVMQEMWRLHLAGELDGIQKLMFQPRPTEELYDTISDPFEMNNLAQDPAHRDTLERLRKVQASWQQEFGDWGLIPEAQMVAGWYANGIQPATAAPIFIPISADNLGSRPSTGQTFSGPLKIQLHCATQGASIAYTSQLGENVQWQLYQEPLPLPIGTTTLRAKAIRIGYQESAEQNATFTVT